MKTKRTHFTAAMTALCMTASIQAADPAAVRVLVWDEQQPEQKQAYGEKFLGQTIAAHLEKQPALTVKSVNLASPEQGLDEATLDATDVIVWWGHRKHGEVTAAHTDAVVKRVMEGKLALIALHSAHFSKPFMRLMDERSKADAPKMIPEAERASAKMDFDHPLRRGTAKKGDPLSPAVEKVDGVWRLIQPACVFPSWRADGAPGHITTLLSQHPIAAGLPTAWDVPKTEMYSEPFHVPQPDAVVFEEKWDKGEHFRSGCVWRVGKGTVFYFRPGHETYPVFQQAETLRVISNAVRWMSSPQK
jgi:trehalose utilization protein